MFLLLSFVSFALAASSEARVQVAADGTITLAGQPPQHCDAQLCGVPLDGLVGPLTTFHKENPGAGLLVELDATVPSVHLRAVVASAQSAGITRLLLQVGTTAPVPLALAPMGSTLSGRGAGDSAPPAELPDVPPPPPMTVTVGSAGLTAFRLVEGMDSAPRDAAGQLDLAWLDRTLAADHAKFPSENFVIFDLDDAVSSADVVPVIGHAAGVGFTSAMLVGGPPRGLLGSVATGGLSAPGSGPGGSLVILGALDAADVRGVLASPKFVGAVDKCEAAARKAAPALHGTIKVKFVVEASGAVSSATVKSSDIEGAPLQACVTAAFKPLKFPKPQGGGIAIISYGVGLEP